MKFFAGRLDGSANPTVLVQEGTTLLVLQRQGSAWKTLAIHSGTLSGSSSWTLKSSDRILLGDVDGDGKDELIIADHDNLAVARLTGGALKVEHKSAGWVKSADNSFGWNLGTNDRMLIGDLDGDGRMEIVLRSDEWLGVIAYDVAAKKLVAKHLSYDWVISADGSFGWNLGSSDQQLVADMDGDGRDEIVLRSPEWLGVVAYNGTKFVCVTLSYDWIMNADSSAGWNLGSGDRHLTGDVDGDGADEVVIRSDEWMGVISLTGGKLVLDHISHDWIHSGDGTGGWNMGAADRYWLADLNNDGRKEIVLRSAEWVGRIAYEGGKLVAKHLSYDWVLSSDGTAGWNLSFTDEHLIYPGKGSADLLLVLNQNSRYVGALSSTGSTYKLDWIHGTWLRAVPSYQPSKWNDGGSVQSNNNCYNYGCDILLFNNKSQPGRAHGITLTGADMNCAAVTSAAKADGLRSQSGSLEVPPDYHKVALVIDPGYDYHWYRLDNNGRWSHKPGRTPATNVDNSGNQITNPELADRGGYTDFCGYFWVSHRDVVIY